MNGVAGVAIDELVVIERQVWLKLRLVEVHIDVCMLEGLDGIKYIVKRPNLWEIESLVMSAVAVMVVVKSFSNY